MQLAMRLAPPRGLRAGTVCMMQGFTTASRTVPAPLSARSFVAFVPPETHRSTLSAFESLEKHGGVCQKPKNVPAAKAAENGTAEHGFKRKKTAVGYEKKAMAAPEKAVDPSEKWKEITVEMWRDAVYTNQTYFGELINDTTEFVKTIAEHIKLNGQRVSFVEVGCGTGEFVRSAGDDFRTAVGVDFNKEFIDYCKENVTPRQQKFSHYLQGDACQLDDLLQTRFAKNLRGRAGHRDEFWGDTRIVACVGNTIGIIPEELRPRVYQQMAEVAGDDGVLVMVYWNARWFGDACLNFYHANPKLCGPFEGESVDFKNTTLTTPMKYKTKWTSVDEAREVMEDLGMEIISLREKGKGVFVAARKKL